MQNVKKHVTSTFEGEKNENVQFAGRGCGVMTTPIPTPGPAGVVMTDFASWEHMAHTPEYFDQKH